MHKVDNSDFDRVCNMVRNNEIILWAGAGLSKYAGYPTGERLSNIIYEHAESEEHRKILEPYINTLMGISNEFEQLYSREKLLDIIADVFDCPPTVELKTHILLSRIPQIDTIVTTNYDKLFEIVYGDRLNVFIGSTYKKGIPGKTCLYKIHGDTDARDSLVLTTKDYVTFYEKQDTLLWDKLRPLLAEKSVLFIGYSVDDKNIEHIFDKVLQQINPVISEFFIVLPNMPEYKIRHFNTICKTTHIRMDGEKFVNMLEKTIRESIVQDAIDKRIGIDQAYSICHEHGIDVTFKYTPNGSLPRLEVDNYITDQISNVISRGFSAKSNTENYQNYIDFMDNCDCKELIIPAKDLYLFEKIQGINLPQKLLINGKQPDICKITKQDDVYYPEMINENEKILVNKVQLKVERGNKKSRITITADATILSIEMANNNVNIKIILNYPHSTINAIRELNIYNKWTAGCALLFRTKHHNKYKIIYQLRGLNEDELTDSLLRFFKENNNLYHNIMLIEKDLAEEFIISHAFSEQEMCDIKKAAATVEPQIIRYTGCIEIKSTRIDVSMLDINQYQLSRIEQEEEEISSQGFAELFGKTILLGRQKITIINPIISNIEEVKKGRLEGKEVPIKIVSDTSEAKLEYIWNQKDKMEYEKVIRELAQKNPN